MSSSHPNHPGNSLTSTPFSLLRVRSLSYSVIINWYFHSFSLRFPLFPFTLFYYAKWMRPYNDCLSLIDYFPSALYPPVPSTSKQVVSLCRFYSFFCTWQIYSEYFILKQQNTHGTFSRINYILDHKSALNKYKKIEIIPCIFSEHSAMKLEVNHKKKFGKTSNTWRLKNILLKNECVK